MTERLCKPSWAAVTAGASEIGVSRRGAGGWNDRFGVDMSVIRIIFSAYRAFAVLVIVSLFGDIVALIGASAYTADI